MKTVISSESQKYIWKY